MTALDPVAPPTDGQRVVAMRDLLCDAYDSVRDLEPVVLQSLGEGLYKRYVGEGYPLDETAFALLVKLEQEGKTERLLKGVLLDRVERVELRERVARYYPNAVPSDTEFLMKGVNGAIKGATANADDPAVRPLIQSSRGSIERLRDGVDVLARYKNLHDCLHTLQVQHFRLVADYARHFRTDRGAGATLVNHLDEVGQVACKARTAAEGLPDAPTVRGQELLWADELTRITTGLRTALDALDDRGAAVEVRKFRTLIRLEPGRVNKALVLTARELPLNDLLDTLQRIAAAAHPDSELRSKAELGVLALEALIPDLTRHINDHWAWQELDRELWYAEDLVSAGSEVSLAEFRDNWPGITAEVQALAATTREEKWDAEIATCRHDVDAALPADPAAHVPERARTAFDRYRQLVLFRFFAVDKALQEKCGKITAMGRPLENLLRKVPDADA